MFGAAAYTLLYIHIVKLKWRLLNFFVPERHLIQCSYNIGVNPTIIVDCYAGASIRTFSL